MDLKKAYHVLDIPENATEEEIEQQYMVWIRQHKAQLNNPNQTPIPMDDINEAYRLIKEDLLDKKYGTKTPKSPFREKLDHFFHYYKFHVVISVVSIVILYSLATTFISAQQEKAYLESLPPAEVDILFVGDYMLEDPSLIEGDILDMIPEWERVTADIIYTPSQASDNFDVAQQQKSMVLIATQKADVYFFDEESFVRFSRSGSLLPLPEEKFEGVEDRFIKTETEENPTELTYGLDVSDHPMFSHLERKPDQLIATVIMDTPNEENALLLLQQFVDTENDK
ncbi:hypothetical protein [Alkalihalobacillus sp. LMS39]|uniref:hypothetical protein n=1 Tax=Alkalihalobacillus sp. LMS39 TaxID=2924032 RepID=UPI001FB2B27E|nr:hypothetical protein [Alkalihalobacillus sp. LMS39]UOE94313.1 hypothetical protein MM271_01090 [Alkalihalobacillus sp. LMS39]